MVARLADLSVNSMNKAHTSHLSFAASGRKQRLPKGQITLERTEVAIGTPNVPESKSRKDSIGQHEQHDQHGGLSLLEP